MRKLTNKEAMKPVVKEFMTYIDNCGLEMAREFLSHLSDILDEMQERLKQ